MKWTKVNNCHLGSFSLLFLKLFWRRHLKYFCCGCRTIVHLVLAFLWSACSILSLVRDRLKITWQVSTLIFLLFSLVTAVVFAIDIDRALVSFFILYWNIFLNMSSQTCLHWPPSEPSKRGHSLEVFQSKLLLNLVWPDLGLLFRGGR